MENPRSSKATKLKSTDDVLSPINMLNFACGRHYSSVFDPYASDSSDSPSPLMKYLRSADPAALVDSPPVFLTPVKVEEDVIVMDGIPVPKSNKKCTEVKTRLPLTSSSVVGGSAGGLNSISSGAGARGNGNDNSKSYKHRLCRFWGTGGACLFGSECQFAHGKEELRPTRSSCKIQLEV
ncbi:hypothetical protein CDL12_21430 [Handroanthus impetiginosus]|uniref:C3H1-type domain-containing protein n=1 Tax=Handroanthus impetiginosus TaxID=429701 RepID=A0A2G9GLD7_9LAMI|nr:hypothetical protein CDL12_21430 [Handroanthus impetiginosus]